MLIQKPSPYTLVQSGYLVLVELLCCQPPLGCGTTIWWKWSIL